jgi:hypothetical protein
VLFPKRNSLPTFANAKRRAAEKNLIPRPRQGCSGIFYISVTTGYRKTIKAPARRGKVKSDRLAGLFLIMIDTQ